MSNPEAREQVRLVSSPSREYSAFRNVLHNLQIRGGDSNPDPKIRGRGLV